MSAPVDRDVYESLVDELRGANQTITILVGDAAVILISRNKAYEELARVRKQVAAITRERDNARKELRRVCAGAGFKVPEGTPS